MCCFGNNLIKIRKTKNLSQKELAEKLNKSQQIVSSWERNKMEPKLEDLIKISKLFEVSLDKLLRGEKSENR